MQRVYRLLKEARERGMIEWDWIVDETRDLERRPSWNDPEAFARAASRQYRRDFWDQQPVRCEVWSEKGTVRGILAPVLDEYGVGFRVMHGFTSATSAHEIAIDDDGRQLIVLYAGDWDPSGLYMSEHDLPERMERYEGHHVSVERIALVQDQLRGLPSFPARDKRKEPMPLKISRAGRQSVKAGLDGESLGMTLLMEVMARLGEVEEQSLYDILDTLVERHGSVEATGRAVLRCDDSHC
jgi:hypothetical protein